MSTRAGLGWGFPLDADRACLVREPATGFGQAGRGKLVGAGELFQLVAKLLQLLAPGHHLDHFFAADLGFAEGAVGAPAVEKREAVADRVGVVDVVGDEDDAEAAPMR